MQGQARVSSQPSMAMAAMVSGMAMPIKRHVVIQRRQPIGLSIFSPAPMRADDDDELRHPFGDVAVLEWVRSDDRRERRPYKENPDAMQTIGSDSGQSLRSIGSHAVKRTTPPNTARSTT